MVKLGARWSPFFMWRRSAFPLAAAITLIISAVGANSRAQASNGDWLDTIVEESMERWEAPGLAVAAVKDGNVVLSRVYGFRDVARSLPVTPRTLFSVGSIAKSFTVIGAASLFEKGRLDLDAPASRYLPSFRPKPVRGGRAVSPRDLLSHRSGLPRHDALWYLAAFTRDGLIDRIRHLRPFARPGAAFQYSNLMVMVAGQVVARVAGAPWEVFTRKRILTPLGLDATRLDISAFLATADRATGYYPGEDGRIVIPPRDTDAIAPAAAVYSNLEDMTRWLRFFLDGGRPVIRRETLKAMLTSRTAQLDPPGHPEFTGQRYAMGFYVDSYRGDRLLSHPGVMDGYATLLSFMPAKGIGVIVLTNISGGNPAPAVVSQSIYDRLTGRPKINWASRYSSARERRAARRQPRVTEPAPTPTAATTDYVGLYGHPAYGHMRIAESADGGLEGRFHSLTFRLQYQSGETWRLEETRWPLRAGLSFRFMRLADGHVTALATPLADGPTYRHNPGEIVFKRDP